MIGKKNLLSTKNMLMLTLGGLDVLYVGLGICKLQFLIKKMLIVFTAVKFLSLVIKTLDLDPGPHPNPHWPEMLYPDPYPNPH
jgi:hypothetical protein